MDPRPTPARPGRRLVLLVGVGVGLGAVVAGVLVALGGSDDDPATVDAPLLTAGEGASPDAVWLFGLDTVRVDPDDLGDVGRLGTAAFGTPFGAGGVVRLVSGSSGRVGHIDAATNTLTTDDSVAVDVADGQTSGAVAGGRAFATTGPATVAVVDAIGVDDTPSVDLGIAGAERTWLGGAGDVLVACTTAAGRAFLATFDPATLLPVASTEIPLPDPPVAVVVGTTRSWIVTAAAVVPLELPRLQGDEIPVGDEVAVGDAVAGAAGILGAAAVGDDLWLLGGDGTTLWRFGDGAPDTWTSVTLVDAPAAGGPTPAGLVAARGALFALVQISPDPERRDVRLVRVDPATTRATHSLDLPTELLVAAIATS
jgi:hypothetical protein